MQSAFENVWARVSLLPNPSQIEAELTSLCQTILATSPVSSHCSLSPALWVAPSEALLTDKLIPGATTAEAKAPTACTRSAQRRSGRLRREVSYYKAQGDYYRCARMQ